MICKEIETGKYFNYRFLDNGEVIEIDDCDGFTKNITRESWLNDYYIIDKWRCLTDYDIEYNRSLKKW